MTRVKAETFELQTSNLQPNVSSPHTTRAHYSTPSVCDCKEVAGMQRTMERTMSLKDQAKRGGALPLQNKPPNTGHSVSDRTCKTSPHSKTNGRKHNKEKGSMSEKHGGASTLACACELIMRLYVLFTFQHIDGNMRGRGHNVARI